jgi:TP901 family phage tail tape measure protein
MAIDLDVHGNTKPLEAAVQAAINRIRRQPIKITVDDKGATQPLGNMKRAADEFSKSMEAANARILAFGASMAIINGVADAFKGMVRNLVEVEKSMADINVVMGLSAQNLDKFGDGLFKVAKETGAAFRVAADAATEYARQGLSMEESLKRTRDALILTRLTGMDSAEAVKSLTAAMNTYGNQIKDTTQLVSKFAAVDVQFAVSAEDFAAAISRTGQAAKTAGVDIDELIGIVTSAQQQTARGGAVIGNALKTIFTKTGRTDTLNQLEDLGIAVRDLEGNTIGAKRILTELANTFDHLSESQKAQITQTMGGLFHINILKAVLSDAAKQNGILARATEISSSATDEAIQKNQQLRETMSAMATETGLAIKQVSTQIGEIALAPGMEKILNTVKSLAEGLSGVLGDGEGMGNKFATGLLKGIGNVITGPGLVVLTAVFFKLFGQAAKFTKESLSSLIGISSEAQKQKAIQASLVALIGQNAALGKEMLRTDITRTEKEKILLGLLQAQTAEASKLNAISKQLASTLYTRGYGPGLTQGKRRAYGHIPNFADPERAQAAKGGYAAGSIRTMNMPGEGSVIYNSAETVKNFAGFKQPAIMPPQSSKAGKNYQQAFGSIHGFDPYAAGGYIPNFARLGMSNAKFAAKINRGEMTVDEAVAKGYTGGLAGKTVSKTSDLKNQRFKYLNKGGSQYVVLVASEGPDSVAGHYFVGNKKMSPNRAYQYPSAFKNKKGVNPARVDVPFYSLDARDKDLNSGKNSPYRNAIYNGLKESGSNLISKILTDLGFGSKAGKRNILTDRDVSAMGGNVFEGVIASVLNDANFKNYQSRGETARIDLPKDDDLYRLFGVKGGSLGAEAKITSGKNNIKDAAVKFYDMLAFGEGFVPNFANPLSDAIGREKAAGVPVSQIRVGSHNALMSKGNPLGLGVTNTRDEPNGLRDVFGANGFVPNYAFNPFGLFSPDEQAENKISSLNRKIERQEKAVDDHTKSLKNLKAGTDKYNRTQQLLNQTTANLQKTRTQVSSLERRSLTSSMKKMGGAMNSGMGMASIGMLSGFVDDPAIGSAMAYASTGGYIGSMLAPVLGPLAPFGPLIGAAAGGLYGFVDGLEQADKAVRDKAKAEQQAAEQLRQAQTAKFAQALSGAFSISPSERVGDLSTTFKSPGHQYVLGAMEDKESPDQKLGGVFSGKTYLDIFHQLSKRGERGGSKLEYQISEQVLSEMQSAARARETVTHLERKIADKYAGLQLEDIENEDKRAQIKDIRERISAEFTQGISSAAISGTAGQASTFAKRDILSTVFSAQPGQKFFDETFKEIFGDFEVSSEQIQDWLQSQDIDTDKKDKLNKLFDVIYQDMIKQESAQSQQVAAAIKQFDMQKASLIAQDEFNKKMHKVNKHFASLSNQYAYREQTMGRFMSQAQKNELNYNKSLTKINETYTKAITKNVGQEKESLLSRLRDPKLAQGFKDLGKSPEEVGKMDLEQLKKYAETIKDVTGEKRLIKSILDASTQSLQNKNNEAERALVLSKEEAENQKAIADEILRQRTGPKAFQYGFAAQQTKMRQSADELDHQLGTIVATNFRDGLVSGMQAAINQAEDLGDVMRGIATNFFQAIQNAYLTAAANRIVSSIPIPGVAKSRGGSIRNYSQGGGVPAMVSNGEYVMGRDAVAKYGGSFMHGLNAGGKIPGYSNGGATGSAIASGFGGGEGYVSGRKYQNKAMSGYFYSQSGNVGLEEDAAKMSEIIRERNERQEKEYQKAMEKYQKKMQLVQAAVGAAMSAGISWGADKFGGWIDSLSESGALGESAMLNSWGKSSGIDTVKVQSAMKQNPKLSRTQAMSKVQPFEESNLLDLWGRDSTVVSSYRGGPIRKYVSGGYISGKSGIDQIPAMLSEGEYVIRASSARQLGKPMLDRINAGKFNQGGAVSELMGSNETAASGGNTNNITISINMERGSGSKQETQKQDSAGQNPADRSNEEQNSSALAERIKQQVVAVIAEEQRPGGLLSE